MAKSGKSKASAKPDLATGKRADAALEAPRSIYEIVGISTDSYHGKTLETYQRELASMSLTELHDHAYKLGVLASQSRTVTISRLEEAFARERARLSVSRRNESAAPAPADTPLREQALRALSRGR